MIADQNFYDICFPFFYPTALAMAYSWRLKFVRAKYLATDEGKIAPTAKHCILI